MQENLNVAVSAGVDAERYKKIILSAEEKLDRLGIKYGVIDSWRINARAKKRFGQCKNSRGVFAIEISDRIFEAGDRAVEEVIMHELLHSCEGCMNHGALWKKYADMANREFGFHISATASDVQYGIDGGMEEKEYKYIFRCAECKRTQGYYKKCRTAKILLGEEAGYAICRCGSKKFERIK